MVLLAPDGPTPAPELFRRDQTDSDGSFLLRNVIPGSYTAVAIEDGWSLDWARPEVFRRYLAGGKAIVVPPGKAPLLQLSAPLAVQAR
jgi:hypothetical protein